MKKAIASLAESEVVAELLPTSNQEVGPKKKHDVEYKLAKGRGECENGSLN